MKPLVLASLAIVGGATQAADTLAPAQFNWQQAIKVDVAGEAVYRFDLPAAVHEGSRRQDLGDIRIFNGAGEVVPHALLNFEPPGQTDVAQTSVAFFPLHRDGKTNEGALSVSVRQIAGGTLVSTRVSPVAPNQAQRVGYVIDASAVRNSRRALLPAWQPQPNGTVLSMHVDGSNDLQSWQPIGPATQLVDLHSGDQHLQHKRIDLAGATHKYFRIRWPDGQEGIVVTAMRLETSSTADRSDRKLWKAASPVRPGTMPGEFLFESPALPLAAVRIDLPAINTVVPLRLEHRRNERDAWQGAASTVAYRIMKSGQELRSPAIELCCSKDRYWRIVFDQRGGGIGQGLPNIDLGWAPQQGLFVARGTGPFLLAYGNAAIAPAAFAAATLVPGYQPEQYPAFAEAKFDAPVAQAAATVVIADPASPNWRTMGLWGVLIAGVLVLAAMAWQLLRQVDSRRD
jgi:hypothetical protein